MNTISTPMVDDDDDYGYHHEETQNMKKKQQQQQQHQHQPSIESSSSAAAAAANAIPHRMTKIICTIGPACWSLEHLEQLLLAGMNVARFDFSYSHTKRTKGTKNHHIEYAAALERLRIAANTTGKNVAILLDTKGPEIRIGYLKDGYETIQLQKGEQIILTSDPYSYSSQGGDAHQLTCSYEKLVDSVNVGQSIIIMTDKDYDDHDDDNNNNVLPLFLTVLSCDIATGECVCRIENNHTSIRGREKIHLPGVNVDLPTFTVQDIHDIISFGIQKKVDLIAASGIRNVDDVKNLRQLLADNHGQHIKVICKIENQQGLEHYEEILQAADGIMVSRGNLGLEIPPSKVILAQKYMIQKANLVGKPIITAAQFLESMMNNPRPTRTEYSDIANAVYDGTDCVMLTGETAQSPYFLEAVYVMANICIEAEKSRNEWSTSTSVSSRMVPDYSLASSTVKLSRDVHAKLIVILSNTGTTARYVAKFRPISPIICLTTNPYISRQLNGILWGCQTFVVPSLVDSTVLSEYVARQALLAGIVQPNDCMVVVFGTAYMRGENDHIRVKTIHSKDDDHYSDAVMSYVQDPKYDFLGSLARGF